MINTIYSQAETKMKKSIEKLREDFSKIRTGRAHPSLIENLQVSVYGTDTPLQQVASVAVEDARTLVITPWDKSNIQAIEKAIMASDLGLNPNSAGVVIRVPMPALTEERRRDLTRVVRDEAERSRVAVRNARRDANSELKELQKAKEIGEDEARGAEARIQKLTDQYIKEVDEYTSAKEADLLSV